MNNVLLVLYDHMGHITISSKILHKYEISSSEKVIIPSGAVLLFPIYPDVELIGMSKRPPAFKIPDSLPPCREQPTSRCEGFQMPVCFCPSNIAARQFVDHLPSR